MATVPDDFLVRLIAAIETPDDLDANDTRYLIEDAARYLPAGYPPALDGDGECRRYFADRYDADGRWYVFDGEDAGSQCCGPFSDEGSAAQTAADLNTDNDHPRGLRPHMVRRAVVSPYHGEFPTTDDGPVLRATRNEDGEWSVIITTPEDNDIWRTMSVYLNDGEATGWA